MVPFRAKTGLRDRSHRRSHSPLGAEFLLRTLVSLFFSSGWTNPISKITKL